jgi:pyridoxal phosphate enzyme (YggS family)
MADGDLINADGTIAARLAIVTRLIADAARKAGRQEADVTLVAVSKGQHAEAVKEAAAANVRSFGENYVAELVDKQLATESLVEPIKWHFIGHLQSNKIRHVVGRVALIQSVDRLELMSKLDLAASRLGICQQVLIQVKLGDEPTKAGCPIEQVGTIVDACEKMEGVAVQGLMGIAPMTNADGTPAEAKRYFEQLHDVFCKLPVRSQKTLSMGMSHDFETAIMAGSTMVRIGTLLFGPRSQPPR